MDNSTEEQRNISGLIDKSTQVILKRLYNKAIADKTFEGDFNSWLDHILTYGLIMESLIQSNRVHPDVFEDVTSIQITSSKDVCLN